MPPWIRKAAIALEKLWNIRKRRKAAARFLPGTVIRGRYTIVKPVGEGSYGMAYLCHDREMGDRLCVLKHVQPLRGAKGRAESAFGLETAMLQRIRHASVPSLLEQFHDRGMFCFTMEYVPGTSLETLLFEEERQFSEIEALTILLSILDIVQEVHKAGIVHRDIRIANVIWEEVEDRIYLIDFGLARDLKPASDPAALHPDDVGEDDPMEKRLRRRLDVVSDFYALGHLLLFLLYSTYPEDSEEQCWEDELQSLNPATKKLLRRLLMTEQPYESAEEAARDVENARRACLQESAGED